MKKLVFKLNESTEIPMDLIRDAPSQGQFDDYAIYIMDHYEIDVSLEDSIKCLKSYGAWGVDELQDLEANKMRLLWISVLDCRENNNSSWYMGT